MALAPPEPLPLLSEVARLARRPGMLTISAESHTDHGLTQAHADWLVRHFADRDGFFIETLDMPDELPDLMCALHGPIMGDGPVVDAEVRMVVRGARRGLSRICHLRAGRPTRKITVIAGPHGDDPCFLYTAFGGPSSPREPWDPALLLPEHKSESESFWAVHALSPG